MSTFHSFEDIQAWQESRKLVRMIREICKRNGAKRDFSFVDQITRAARSVSANIAEGSDSVSVPQFITFLGYAKSSNAEVRSHLFDALDEQYISQFEFDELVALTKKIGGMIGKLMRYLQHIDHNRKRIGPKSTSSPLKPLNM